MLELYFLGEAKYITLDDSLPVKPVTFYYDPGDLINSKVSNNGAWWLPLLEKGMAKFMQNYLALDGGWETIALRALTGMPADRI